MARCCCTVLSASFLFTLLNSVYAVDMGAQFFEQHQRTEFCQVYTLLESPVVLETLVQSNTILTHEACGCEITITNAPTLLKTTLTVTSTLGQNAFPTSSSNPRYPAVSSLTDNLNIPIFYISITGTWNQKRQSNSVQYLKADGSLTTNASEAVQIYESDGQLFTTKGAPAGTYYTDVNVESITFAPQTQYSLTPMSIAGHFSLGAVLAWEHSLFTDSQAYFALTPGGIVKAIFNGKYPPGMKRIGLILTRVDNHHLVSSITEGSGGGPVSTKPRKHSRTSSRNLNGLPGPKTYRPTSTQDFSPTDKAASIVVPNVHPAFSNSRSEETVHFTRHRENQPYLKTITDLDHNPNSHSKTNLHPLH